MKTKPWTTITIALARPTSYAVVRYVARFESSSSKEIFISLQVALKLLVWAVRVLLPFRWQLRSSWIAILESVVETLHLYMSVNQVVVFVAIISRIQHCAENF
jgi:hypothetical protein